MAVMGRQERRTGIWLMLLAAVVSGDYLSIHILVQRGELYKRAFGVAIIPHIEFHDDAVHGEEQVVIRLLQRLCDGV